MSDETTYRVLERPGDTPNNLTTVVQVTCPCCDRWVEIALRVHSPEDDPHEYQVLLACPGKDVEGEVEEDQISVSIGGAE